MLGEEFEVLVKRIRKEAGDLLVARQGQLLVVIRQFTKLEADDGEGL